VDGGVTVEADEQLVKRIGTHIVIVVFASQKDSDFIADRAELSDGECPIVEERADGGAAERPVADRVVFVFRLFIRDSRR
jgi:hypothetical protein